VTDSNNATSGEGQKGIDPDVRLLRRVSPQFMKPLPDGGIRVSAGAFQNSTNTEGMSVLLEDTLQTEERTPASTISAFPDFGLVSLTAGFCASEDQTVKRAPEDDEPAHGEVIGKKSPGRRKRFAQAASWIVQPA
jgi:hypothetical protein